MGGVLYKDGIKYCSIIRTDIVTLNLPQLAYKPMPFGDNFNENVGNFKINEDGYITVPEDGIYYAEMNGCIQIPETGDVASYIYTFLESSNEFKDGRCIQKYEFNSLAAIYFKNSVVLNLKPNMFIKMYFGIHGRFGDFTFLNNKYPLKIFVIKIK